MNERGVLFFQITNHTRVTFYIEFVSGLILDKDDWFPALSAHAFLEKPADHGYPIKDLSPGETVRVGFEARKECLFSINGLGINAKTDRSDDCLALQILSTDTTEETN